MLWERSPSFRNQTSTSFEALLDERQQQQLEESLRGLGYLE